MTARLVMPESFRHWFLKTADLQRLYYRVRGALQLSSFCSAGSLLAVLWRG